MKRTELKRKTPLLSAEIRALGSARSSVVRATDAGIDPDAPRNKHGQRCVELVCQVCGDTFLSPPSGAGSRRTCGRDCAAKLRRARGGTHRLGEKNPNFRTGARVGVRDREGERRWYAAAVDYCQNPDCPGELGRLALHHCIYAQHVLRAGGDRWDPRNALTLCTSCHMSHHRRGRVLQLDALPNEVFAFARDLLGPGAAYEYLIRRYVGEDERAAGLLAEWIAEAA